MVRPQGKNRLRTVLDESDEDISLDSEREANVRTSPRKSKKNQPSTSKAEQSKRKQSQPQKRNQSAATSRPQEQSSRRQQHNETNQYPKHIHEIIKYQNTYGNLLPRAPFSRLIKEIIHSYGDFRLQFEALVCLQDATEAYFVQLFEDAYKLTLHRKRITCHPTDIALVLYLRGLSDPGNR